MHVAAAKGHVDLVRHLLRLGADLEAREGLGGRTALHLAIEHRRRELVQYLVHEARPKFDTRTYAGLTAYHVAYYSDPQLAKELARLGATPSTPPDLQSDSESESDEEDETEDSEAYLQTLARIGIHPKAAVASA